MALKSSREGLRKELVDYLGNLIVDNNLRNEIIKVVGDNFATSESLNEAVNNLTMQITTESGERIEADDILQNNINAETTAREGADTTLQNNINAEITAREQAISNLESLIGSDGLQIDLLWENASPTTPFAQQTISLDLSNYKAVYISFKAHAIDSLLSFIYRACICLKNTTSNAPSFPDSQYIRKFTVNNDGVTFDAANCFLTYASTSNVREDNYISIPIVIYGIK